MENISFKFEHNHSELNVFKDGSTLYFTGSFGNCPLIKISSTDIEKDYIESCLFGYLSNIIPNIKNTVRIFGELLIEYDSNKNICYITLEDKSDYHVYEFTKEQVRELLKFLI